VAADEIGGALQGKQTLAASAFNARVIPSVAYTDPEIAWLGLTEAEAKAPAFSGRFTCWAGGGPRSRWGRGRGLRGL